MLARRADAERLQRGKARYVHVRHDRSCRDHRRRCLIDHGARGGVRRCVVRLCDADASAGEPVGNQRVRVVDGRARRRAHEGRRIFWIRPGKDVQHDGRACHIAGHRTRRVLIGGDRNDAVATDQTYGRLDADEHVLVRRAENRPDLSTDVRGGEVCRSRDPQTRAAGRECRSTVGEQKPTGIGAGPRILAWVPRVVSIAANGAVVGGHGIGYPIGQLCQDGLADDDSAGSRSFVTSVASYGGL